MATNHSVIVAGHICLDIIPDISGGTAEEGKAMLLPGRLTTVGAATLSTGGPTSNTGLSLHKLGIPTKLMGKTGDDLFGSAIAQLLAGTDESLAKGMIVDPRVETSYTVVINPPGIDRILFHCSGANDDFTSDDIDYDLVPGLSTEASLKLGQYRPQTLGQASRISGITPVAISLLLVHLKKRSVTTAA